MGQADWQKRRDILICIICMGLIIWALWNLVNQFINAILLFLLAMAIAFLITPIVNRLEEIHLPRLLATIITYLLVLVVLTIVVYTMISSLVGQVTVFSDTIISYTNAIPQNFSAFIQFLHTQGGIPQQRIDDTINQFSTQVSDFANAAINNTINIIFLLTNAFLDMLITLVISFYLTLDGKRIRNSIISIVPRRSMQQVLMFEDALTRVVGNYIRGQTTLALIVGLLVTLVCTFTGLNQFAIIFGMLGFLFETIPMVGPALASISPILASLLLPDPFPRTLIVIVCFILIQIIESNILGPRIVGNAVGLHPIASIMALLIFATLFGRAFGAFGGAMGALIATPIAAAAWVVIASTYRSLHGETTEQIRSRQQARWNLHRPVFKSPLRRKSEPLKKQATSNSGASEKTTVVLTSQPDGEEAQKRSLDTEIKDTYTDKNMEEEVPAIPDPDGNFRTGGDEK